jgi:hypothetical protein
MQVRDLSRSAEANAGRRSCCTFLLHAVGLLFCLSKMIKTLPSRLDAHDLARLAAAGARRAGPPPLPRHPGT